PIRILVGQRARRARAPELGAVVVTLGALGGPHWASRETAPPARGTAQTRQSSGHGPNAPAQRSYPAQRPAAVCDPVRDPFTLGCRKFRRRLGTGRRRR